MIRTNIGHPAITFQWTPSRLRWPTPEPSTVEFGLGDGLGEGGNDGGSGRKGIFKPMLPLVVLKRCVRPQVLRGNLTRTTLPPRFIQKVRG